MNELIQITTGGQGSPVVSARELHEFFEVKTEFVKWCKRMFEYGFTEEQDYVQVFAKKDENPTVGRPLTDYALTLDCAKEIAMLQRSEKGKQARQYFIEAEKALQQTQTTAAQPFAPTTEQVLIQLMSQSNQLLSHLTGTQELLAQLRAEVDEIKAGNTPPSALRPSGGRRAVGGRQLGLPGIPPPSAPSLRLLINRKIDEYCDRSGYDRRDTWNYLYKRLFQVYGIDPHRLRRIGTESMLDAIERYGHLDRLYSLIMAELTYTED